MENEREVLLKFHQSLMNEEQFQRDEDLVAHYLTHDFGDDAGAEFLWQFIDNANYLDEKFRLSDLSNWAHNVLHDLGVTLDFNQVIHQCVSCGGDMAFYVEPGDLKGHQENYCNQALYCFKSRHCLPDIEPHV